MNYLCALFDKHIELVMKKKKKNFQQKLQSIQLQNLCSQHFFTDIYILWGSVARKIQNKTEFKKRIEKFKIIS